MCEVRKMKNLVCAPKEEQKKFFASFDLVFCDMDGVIWLAYNPIKGAADCINNLKKIGKNVVFITNNATSSTTEILQILHKGMFSACIDDIVNPAVAYKHILKEINFNKKIFLVGSEKLKNELRQAKFKIAENPPFPIEEEVSAVANNIVDDEEIGAVIVDYDINLTFLKLQKALTYLKRDDCHFILGSGDKMLPFPKSGPLLGNHYFYESLKYISGREPRQMAKPSLDYVKFVKQQFHITNHRRVLVIGDSVREDLKFATHSGYQKLLVLTGITKKEELSNWKYDEEDKPEYYVESLSALNLILEMLK